LPQVAPGGGLRDRLAAQVAQLQLVEAGRRVGVEGDRAGVLADGGAEPAGQADVLRHQVQRQAGLGTLLLQRPVHLGDLGEVGRQVGRGAANEFEALGVELAAVHGESSWERVAIAFPVILRGRTPVWTAWRTAGVSRLVRGEHQPAYAGRSTISPGPGL